MFLKLRSRLEERRPVMQPMVQRATASENSAAMTDIAVEAKPKSSVASAYLLLVVTMLSWAGNAIVGRALAGVVPPFGMSLMRWTLAFLTVFPFVAGEILAKRAIILSRWRILLTLGLLGLGICNSLGYIGLQWTTALNAALINSAGPMLTLAAAFVFYRERAASTQIWGMLISLLGVLVIVLRGDVRALFALDFNRGDLAILAGVGTWAVYTVMLRHRPPELSPLALLGVLFAIGAVAVLPFHMAESWLGYPLPATTPAVLGYLYVGLFPAVVAFFGWNRGVAVLGANRASLFSHLIPLFSAFLAFALLHERIELYHFAGAALIFLGIFLANGAARR
jgi:drug/metabolite transporter (DMT)-like permease